MPCHTNTHHLAVRMCGSFAVVNFHSAPHTFISCEMEDSLHNFIMLTKDPPMRYEINLSYKYVLGEIQIFHQSQKNYK